MKKIVINTEPLQDKLYHEWLVTNGIGGFACGTICSVPTRKYHSLLNAALAAPFGRCVMLNYVHDRIGNMDLSSIQKHGDETSFSCNHLTHFRLENGIPYWTFEHDGVVIEKSLFLINRQNTVCLSYKVLQAPGPLQLEWRPFFHMRPLEQAVDLPIPDESYKVQMEQNEYEISCPGFPMLRITNNRVASFTFDHKRLSSVYYSVEEQRGYQSVGGLTSPGYFTVQLQPDERTSFLISTEPWETVRVLTPKAAFRTEMIRKRNLLKSAGAARKYSVTAKLVLAADQFVMTPYTRFADMIRLQASGEEVRSVIAGYPWFTDWGRDTMISLEGLTLVTGRSRDALAILHTFAHYVRDGLIPNMFPDGQTKGIYNTADATLWFFHAIDRYIAYTNDEEVLEFLLPTLQDIIDKHLKGTLFGIRADSDGLLIQGAEGFQLTWMDAKVDDWVVTPRRGKAVEINALWYNALKLYEKWSGEKLEVAERCAESFNSKFWYQDGGYLYDVIDGEKEKHDKALRPNQLFAISLSFPVLREQRWKQVLDIVTKELVTPVGLRTLSPDHPEYKTYYHGDLRTRDAAYHQGTVWPWLFGPYIDVWLKVYPNDHKGAYQALKGLVTRFEQNTTGSIEEIYDATGPYKERGCFAQAWSVAELLRCLMRLEDQFS